MLLYFSKVVHTIDLIIFVDSVGVTFWLSLFIAFFRNAESETILHAEFINKLNVVNKIIFL